MWVKKPNDFELKTLLEDLLLYIKAGDEALSDYEFQFDKKIKDIKGSSDQATKAKGELDIEKFNTIRERRITTVKNLLDSVSKKLNELEAKH